MNWKYFEKANYAKTRKTEIFLKCQIANVVDYFGYVVCAVAFQYFLKTTQLFSSVVLQKYINW